MSLDSQESVSQQSENVDEDILNTAEELDELKTQVIESSTSQDLDDLSSQAASPEIIELTQKILNPPEESELTKEQQDYKRLKDKLNEAVKSKKLSEITSSVKELLKLFLKWYERKINIWSSITYSPQEKDEAYLINLISTEIQDPEKRSTLTYLLWKIKDEKEKQNLKEKWIENPTQFQLFLQNCKPWQLLLTNWESTSKNKRHETFSKATQIVSWARRCHAAVISEVIEENWIIKDVKIVQATGEWIKETTLKDYFKKTYTSSDLLVWSFNPPDKGEAVVNHCKSYIWNQYSQKNLVADTILNNIGNISIKKEEKKKYCSELVFTWMQEAGLELPDPHTTPADLLSTKAIVPEYCCYCDKFE